MKKKEGPAVARVAVANIVSIFSGKGGGSRLGRAPGGGELLIDNCEKSCATHPPTSRFDPFNGEWAFLERGDDERERETSEVDRNQAIGTYMIRAGAPPR